MLWVLLRNASPRRFYRVDSTCRLHNVLTKIIWSIRFLVVHAILNRWILPSSTFEFNQLRIFLRNKIWKTWSFFSGRSIFWTSFIQYDAVDWTSKLLKHRIDCMSHSSKRRIDIISFDQMSKKHPRNMQKKTTFYITSLACQPRVTVTTFCLQSY